MIQNAITILIFTKTYVNSEINYLRHDYDTKNGTIEGSRTESGKQLSRRFAR